MERQLLALHEAWLQRAAELEASKHALFFKPDVIDAYRQCAADLLALMKRIERGAEMRAEREGAEVGLRERAREMGLTPTELSKMERGELDQ